MFETYKVNFKALYRHSQLKLKCMQDQHKIQNQGGRRGKKEGVNEAEEKDGENHQHKENVEEKEKRIRGRKQSKIKDGNKQGEKNR